MKPNPVISLLIILVVVGGGYFYFSRDNSNFGLDQSGSRFANLGFLKSDTREPPTGSREYRTERYNFSLFYPEGMSVNEFDDGGGARTITFEDAEDGLGFQVFVVPYAEAQVSEERFLKDTPSGERVELEEIMVDGATGAAFYSRHLLLGETREMWFIHNGFLFEVTAPRLLDMWLANIVQTWEFL